MVVMTVSDARRGVVLKLALGIIVVERLSFGGSDVRDASIFTVWSTGISDTVAIVRKGI